MTVEGKNLNNQQKLQLNTKTAGAIHKIACHVDILSELVSKH